MMFACWSIVKDNLISFTLRYSIVKSYIGYCITGFFIVIFQIPDVYCKVWYPNNLSGVKFLVSHLSGILAFNWYLFMKYFTAMSIIASEVIGSFLGASVSLMYF